MTWSTEDGAHEGWASLELRGGRQSHGWTGGGLLVGYRDDGTDEIVPYGEIVGWRGRCECGWLGEFWSRVPDPAQMNPLLRRIYATDEDASDPPSDVEDAIHAEWKLHIEPDLRLADVRQAAAAAARTRTQLDDAVRAARAAGASWADIGSAVGITRQSARERWGTDRGLDKETA